MLLWRIPRVENLDFKSVVHGIVEERVIYVELWSIAGFFPAFHTLFGEFPVPLIHIFTRRDNESQTHFYYARA